ncbi:hypothetical protein [Streptomyces sp. PR69]|uniref:hypothetical protein n=1 Tax=Streptomyces sp. PR69 TaxID=2984950 RepID=UPI002263E5A6|nr:hypothetical protein [Streptomyces sp. PR69]
MTVPSAVSHSPDAEPGPHGPVFPERVLAAVRPDRPLQLADAVGAVDACRELQYLSPGECFLLLADLRPLAGRSGRIPHRTLVEDAVRAVLALGVDPERCLVYRQSDVPHVFELMWMLCGRLGGAELDQPRPLLRAADILGVRATRFIAGGDPSEGPDLARSIARRMNEQYGLPLLAEPVCEPRAVPDQPGGAVGLSVFADEQTLSAQLDALVHSALAPSAGTAGLTLLETLAPAAAAACAPAGRGGGQSAAAELKRLAMDGFARRFAEARERYAKYATEPTLPCEVLGDGASRARREAAEVVAVVKEALRERAV